MLLADPGVAARRIKKIEEAFLAEACDVFVDEVTVEIEMRSLRITPEGSLDIEALRELDADHLDADAVMLTEVPRHVEGRPLVAEILPKNRTAVVSYPTLGVLSPAQLR